MWSVAENGARLGNYVGPEIGFYGCPALTAMTGISLVDFDGHPHRTLAPVLATAISH